MPPSRPACYKAIVKGTGKPHPLEDDRCGYPRMKGKQQCEWHWLAKQPAAVQEKHAAARREDQLGHDHAVYQARVPQEKWPTGERWCSGCQSFVPLFYVSGSRCRACNSKAAHAGHVEKTYGITQEEYDALFRLQRGRCYICQRVARSRRLAVDHDHETGQVRGLLCSDSERGCNHAILGNIKDLAMARRIVAYLEHPPYDRLRGIPPSVPVVNVEPPKQTQPPPF